MGGRTTSAGTLLVANSRLIPTLATRDSSIDLTLFNLSAYLMNLNNSFIKADTVRISSVKELWELMVRNDHYMPELKSKYCTMKTLLHVKEGKLFGMKHSAMKFKKIA